MSEMDMLREDRRRLADDLKRVVRDAESILRQKVQDAGEGYDEATERLSGSLTFAKDEIETVESSMVASSREAMESTDRYIRRHPWESIGVGVGIGLLLGLIVGRK